MFYHAFGALLTTSTAYFVKPWASFVVAMLWATFWLWDIVIRPSMFPETELTEEERFRQAMEVKLAREGEQGHRQMRMINQRLNEQQHAIQSLQKQLAEARAEYQEKDSNE